MIYVALALIAILIGLFVFLKVNEMKNRNQFKAETLTFLKQFGQIEEKDKTIEFHYQDQIYNLLFYFVPTQAELTINSPTIWEIKSKSNREFINQSAFLMTKYPKMVFIYPTIQRIKRYINENELVFIRSKDFFYQMHVISHLEIKNFFKGETS